MEFNFTYIIQSHELEMEFNFTKIRRGRLRWFGHLECRSVDDWVSACRRVEVAALGEM